MAGGRGTRLTGGLTSKALYSVRGQPLIDYILNAALTADLKTVVVLVRHEDQDLQTHLNGWIQEFPDLRVLHQSGGSTGVAARRLIASIDNRSHLFSTCDVVCNSEDLAQILEASRILLGPQDLGLLALTEITGHDLPIWVEADSSWRVTRFGKGLRPSRYTWGNIRYCTERYEPAVQRHPWRTAERDTTVFSHMVAEYPGKFKALLLPHLYDVDTPTEAEWAERRGQ